MPDWRKLSDGIDPDCAHNIWDISESDGQKFRVCGACLATEVSGSLDIQQPEMHCPKCHAVIPDNYDLDVRDFRAKFGREPEEDEIDKGGLSGRKRHMGLMACPACALDALPLKPKVKATGDTGQMIIEAPSLEIT